MKYSFEMLLMLLFHHAFPCSQKVNSLFLLLKSLTKNCPDTRSCHTSTTAQSASLSIQHGNTSFYPFNNTTKCIMKMPFLNLLLENFRPMCKPQQLKYLFQPKKIQGRCPLTLKRILGTVRFQSLESLLLHFFFSNSVILRCLKANGYNIVLTIMLTLSFNNIYFPS